MPFGSLPPHRDAHRFALRLALLSSIKVAMDENINNLTAYHFPVNPSSSFSFSSVSGSQRNDLFNHFSSPTSLLLLQAAVASEQQKRTETEAYNALLIATLQAHGPIMTVTSKGYPNPNIPTTRPSLSSFFLDQNLQPPQSAPKPSATQTFIKLGSSLRCRSEPYIDCMSLESPIKYTRPVRSKSFPMKVYRMLKDLEEQGRTDIASFYSHGRAFGVHDVDGFVAEIMPKYFNQTQWSSFRRQLRLWGLTRITSGPDAGGYYHELFLNGRPDLVIYMKRVGAPTHGVDRRKKGKNKLMSMDDPEFYGMKPAL
jgi:hypothetical protein